MSILYAFMSQPHYDLWSKDEKNQDRLPTKENFMKEYGTPLITFSADGRDGFHPLPQGSSIIVNFQYYNDLNKKFKITPTITDELKILNQVYIPEKSVSTLLNKMHKWFIMRFKL
jgi:hypothetical protein